MKKERNIIKFDPKASVTKVELSRNQDKGQIDVCIRHTQTYIFNVKLKQILNPQFYSFLKKECGFDDETLLRTDVICYYQEKSCLMEFWYGIDTKWKFRKLALSIKIENLTVDKIFDTAQYYYEIVLATIDWEELRKHSK